MWVSVVGDVCWCGTVVIGVGLPVDIVRVVMSTLTIGVVLL